MKKIKLASLFLTLAMIANAQKDSLFIGQDTIKIGSIMIINKPKEEVTNRFKTTIQIGDSNNRRFNGDFKKTRILIGKSKRKVPKNILTNWWIIDLGFSNYKDKTPNMAYAMNGINTNSTNTVTPQSFSLNNRKSTNINIWVVQQKLNLIKHQVNLKYGVGFEMYNFRFDNPISFRNNEPGFIKMDEVLFSKNKLFVQYLTVPVQLNFQPNPENSKSFYGSIGLSAGYLIRARNKQISDERGKEKFNGNFNLNDLRYAVIGELGVGGLRLYGSSGLSNLFNKKLTSFDLQPFSIGVRFSRF